MTTALDHTWLRPEEAADVLRISRTSLYRLIRSGALPASRLPSGVLRVRASDVEALLDPTYAKEES